MAVRLIEKNVISRIVRQEDVGSQVQRFGIDARLSFNLVQGVSVLPVRHVQVERAEMSNGSEYARVLVICYAPPPVRGESPIGKVEKPYYQEERDVYKGRSTRIGIFPKEYTIRVD